MYKYSFKEAHLSKSFCLDKYAEILNLIKTGISFTTIGIPGVGVSFLLRFLASQKVADFIFTDMYTLMTPSKFGCLKSLAKELGIEKEFNKEDALYEAIYKKLEVIVKDCDKLVIIFNRFDHLASVLDERFLSNLRALRNINPDRIVMIFTANRPLYELSPQAVRGTNINFFSKIIYITPFSKKDLLEVSAINPILKEAEIRMGGDHIKEFARLSGGHSQIFQIMLKTEFINNPLLDNFIKLQLRELYEFLPINHKQVVQKIVLKKNIQEIDPYLLNIGYIVKQSEGYRIFSPLLEEYIAAIAPIKLPAKEAKLFRLLKSNIGSIISKEEIFDYVWGRDSENATEWALNALIYRMRKHPAFMASGYYIENHKKLGYSLIK